MKISSKELKDVFDGLQAGKLYRPMRDNGAIDNYSYIVRGWNNVEHTEYCIQWQHYGSSANENTIDGLKFISEVIFDDYDKWVEA